MNGTIWTIVSTLNDLVAESRAEFCYQQGVWRLVLAVTFSHLRCCIQVGINHIQMPPFSCLTHKWDSLSSIYLEDTNHCHCILSQHLQFTIIHSAFQNFDYGYLSGLVIVDSTSETKMFPPIWKPTNKMRNKRHTSIKSVFDQFQ